MKSPPLFLQNAHTLKSVYNILKENFEKTFIPFFELLFLIIYIIM